MAYEEPDRSLNMSPPTRGRSLSRDDNRRDYSRSRSHSRAHSNHSSPRPQRYSERRSKSRSRSRSPPPPPRQSGGYNPNYRRTEYRPNNGYRGGPGGPAASAPIPDEQINKILVDNLSSIVDIRHIREIFGQYGPIETVELKGSRHYPREDKISAAFILFEKSEDAHTALHHMDGGMIDDRTIAVKLVRPPKWSKGGQYQSNFRRGGGPGRGGFVRRNGGDRNGSRSPEYRKRSRSRSR